MEQEIAGLQSSLDSDDFSFSSCKRTIKISPTVFLAFPLSFDNGMRSALEVTFWPSPSQFPGLHNFTHLTNLVALSKLSLQYLNYQATCRGKRVIYLQCLQPLSTWCQFVLLLTKRKETARQTYALHAQTWSLEHALV